VRRRYPSRDLHDHLAQRGAVLGPVGPQRGTRTGARRHHVLRLPAAEHPHREHSGVHGVDPPSDLGMERDDHVRQREDGVAPAMRVGAVRGLAGDRDLDRVARRVDRARVERDCAPRQFRVNVCRDHRGWRDRGQLAPCEQLGTGRVGLLTRLKQRHERDWQLLAERVRGARKRHQRSHVHVVSAGMHRGSRGAERDPGPLLHRQAVELRTHRDGALAFGAHARDAPGPGRRLGGHRELLRHRRGGPLLGVRQLGLPMQPLAQLDGKRQLRLERLEQAREQLLSRSPHSAGTPRRDRAPPSPAAPPA